MSISSSLRLERTLIARDRGLIATAVALALILLISLLSGMRADQAETAALRSAAAKVQAEWAAQPPKNPHSAAHYGILVYRPRAPLQAIEPGVLPFQGAVTFLEAHKRNAPMLSPASVRVAERSYGSTRYSPMLQVAGGFLALVLGYLIGAREARRGMIPLLRGSGARGGSVVAAKAICTGVLVLIAALPSLIFAAISVGGGDAGLRFGALLAASVSHLFILAAIGVASGMWLGAARFGLAAVAFAWAMSVMILPRIADTVAEHAVPLTQQSLDAAISADFKRGPAGHGDSPANEVFERQTLARYGVSRKEDLQVNYDALLMQADEDFRAGVYDQRLAEAEVVRARQDFIRQFSWAFGPTPAMLNLSMRIAGADADTQSRFDASAEVFRRDLVGRLNRHMAENSRTGDWEWKPADQYYASFEAFNPSKPTLAEDAVHLLPGISMMFFWGLLALAGLISAAKRFNARAAL